MQIPVTVTRQAAEQLVVQWSDGAFAPPVEIYWSNRPEADAADWEHLVTDVEGAQVTINDPSPGSRPYFLLANARERPGSAGLVFAERRLPLEGSPNFRDLGGYKSSDGRSVRWGQLYRSGDLGRLTGSDLEYLQSLELKVICDFRSEFEVEQSPSRPAAGAESLSLPIAGGDMPMDDLYQAVEKGDFSGLDGQHLVRANQQFVREFTPTYAEMLERVLRDSGRPALIHCTAGKDRTGLGAAILLWVLGVPTKTIFADYLLTNGYNAQRNEMMLGMLRQHIAGKSGVTAETVDLSPMVALMSAKQAYLQAAVDSIMADYGSINNYIRDGLGMSEEERRRFQDVLLVA